MVSGQLIGAVDWRKKKDEKSGQYSYRQGDQWHAVQYGPGFSNTFLVIGYDDVGLQWLLQHERRVETDAEDRTVRP